MRTYKKAQEEVKYLLNYINLIENYNVETLEDSIIHNYAIYNSISKVINIIKKDHKNLNSHSESITPDYIKSIIMSKPSNELHKIIKKQYLIKTRPQRRRSTKIT